MIKKGNKRCVINSFQANSKQILHYFQKEVVDTIEEWITLPTTSREMKCHQQQWCVSSIPVSVTLCRRL